MRTRLSYAMLTAVLLTSAGAIGQVPVISSFHGNGQLAWTNTVNPQAIYRIEWAPAADGPWHGTLQSTQTIDGHSNTVFSAAVPMFFRVVMETNPPPTGMVWIDGGEFVMGDTAGGGQMMELPVHTNFLSGFWMDATEVTHAKWSEVHGWALDQGYSFDNPGLGKAGNHPVVYINWYDCIKWCNARSQKEGLTPCYYTDPALSGVYKAGAIDIGNDRVKWDANGYRLPTEAEWEKAARGGRRLRLFPSGGDTIRHTEANYFANHAYAYDISTTSDYHPTYNDSAAPYTSPVASFAANGYGLYDMAGNVWERCWDRLGDYESSRGVDPRGPDTGTNGVHRGGGWASSAMGARCCHRAPNDLTTKGNQLGFRCVRRR